MNTSSILTNIKITDPQKIDSFINALDASADDPKREPSAPVSRQMTNIDEIRRLMSKRVSDKFMVKIAEGVPIAQETDKTNT